MIRNIKGEGRRALASGRGAYLGAPYFRAISTACSCGVGVRRGTTEM